MAFIPAKHFTRGRLGNQVRFIVIHHWDDPKRRPTFEGTVNWFRTGGGRNSAHYVVEAGRRTQMVSEKDTAWHAGNWKANLQSIGIECNPLARDGDYEEVAALIREIRARHGNIPLKRHKDVSNRPTACPGAWDLARLDAMAAMPASPPKPTTPAPSKPSAAGWMVRGERSERVKRLQRGLIKVFPAYRHAHGRLRVTGTYDATTESWVKEFQRRTGLYQDGKAGPITVAKLAKYGVRV